MNMQPETGVATGRSSSVGRDMPTPDIPQVLLEPHLKAYACPPSCASMIRWLANALRRRLTFCAIYFASQNWSYSTAAPPNDAFARQVPGHQEP